MNKADGKANVLPQKCLKCLSDNYYDPLKAYCSRCDGYLNRVLNLVYDVLSSKRKRVMVFSALTVIFTAAITFDFITNLSSRAEILLRFITIFCLIFNVVVIYNLLRYSGYFRKQRSIIFILNTVTNFIAAFHFYSDFYESYGDVLKQSFIFILLAWFGTWCCIQLFCSKTKY